MTKSPLMGIFIYVIQVSLDAHIKIKKSNLVLLNTVTQTFNAGIYDLIQTMDRPDHRLAPLYALPGFFGNRQGRPPAGPDDAGREQSGNRKEEWDFKNCSRDQ